MTRYDQVLDALSTDIDSLPTRAKVVLFASLSAGLLPLYQEIERRIAGQGSESVEQAIVAVTRFVAEGTEPDWARLLAGIEAATPHGDDIDAPDSNYQQDVAICVDTAIRFAMNDPDASGESIEFALEPLKIFLCLEQLDLMDPGSDAAATRWFNELVDHPRMRTALEFLMTAIAHLKTAPAIGEAAVDELAVRARILLPAG